MASFGGSVALIQGLLILFGIGLGPSLHLVTRVRPSHFRLVACIAPTVGLAIIGFQLFPLVLAGFTIRSTARSLLAANLLLSAALLLLHLTRKRHEGPQRLSPRALLTTVGCFAFLFGSLNLPMILGGRDHTLWQGNSTDAILYMSLGQYVRDIPWSVAQDPSRAQEILQRNPAATMGLILVHDGGRRVAALSLAWMAEVVGTPISVFHYAFNILNLLLGFFVTLAVAEELSLPRGHAHAAALIVGGGFWAQFVIDCNASGQLNSVPLALLFLFAWLQQERCEQDSAFRRERVLLGLSVAGLICCYVECVPLVLAALVGSGLLDVIHHPGRGRMKRALRHAPSLLVAAAFVLPTLPRSLWRVVWHWNAGPGRTIPWADYFYPWLLGQGRFIGGLWGLHFYREALGGSPLGSAAWTLGWVSLGGCLSVAVIVAVVRGLFTRDGDPAARILALLVATFWGSAFLLLAMGHPWFAGKSFGLGYPFGTLATIRLLAVQTRLRRAMTALLITWTASQLGTFLFRTRAVLPGGHEPSEYVRLKTEKISSLTSLLPKIHPGLLAADLTGQPELLVRAWSLILCERSDFLPLQGQRLPTFYGRGRIWWKESNEVPDQFLVAETRDYLAHFGLGRLLARTPPLAVYAVTPADLDAAVIASDILGGETRHAFVMSNLQEREVSGPRPREGRLPLRSVGDRSGVRFLASGTMPLRLRLRFQPQYSGRFSISANGVPMAHIAVTRGQTAGWESCFRPKAGTNWLVFDHPLGGAVPDPASGPAVPATPERLLIEELVLAPTSGPEHEGCVKTLQNDANGLVQ